MTWSRLLGWLASCLGALTQTGCGDAPGIAPPQILLTQDVCDVCTMIISDDRYAAGLVVGHGGEYETRAFDDIGCLLSFEAEQPDATVVARYVHDFRTRTWRDADTAVYLHSRHLHTPMAFGLAALGTEADARALASEYAGDVLDFPTVRERFASGQLILFLRQDPDA